MSKIKQVKKNHDSLTREKAQIEVHAAQLLDVLPQTQCQRCTYQDCETYARAIAHGEADINQCAPGGHEGAAKLAHIMQVLPKDVDPQYGEPSARHVAFIDETWCIGCTLCLPACPVDAIVGSNKQMHTVIEDYCTGCELCVAACPVDCIQFEPITRDKVGWDAWSAQIARDRYALRQMRLKRNEEENNARKLNKLQHAHDNLQLHSKITDTQNIDSKRIMLANILEKSRQKKT